MALHIMPEDSLNLGHHNLLKLSLVKPHLQAFPQNFFFTITVQGSYTNLCQDFSTIDRYPKEKKGRTYPVERGTGMCVLTIKRIPVAGAIPEASRLEQVICFMDRRIRSWCGRCTTSENNWKLLVGYASKILSLTKARHLIIKKEWLCLAKGWGIKRLKLYLDGRRSVLQTDHKPLKYLKDLAYHNDRVFRWVVAIQEYSFRVGDIPGKENIWEQTF